MDDSRIIELFFARNEDAIRHTDDTYGRRLFALADNIVRNAQDAEESVSDTYLRAWNSIPPHRPHHFFGTNVFDEVTVTSFALHSGSAVIQYEKSSALEFSTFDSPMYVVMNDGSRIQLQENSGSSGITRYTLEESIDLSQVDHILLMDGTILKTPQ